MKKVLVISLAALLVAAAVLVWIFALHTDMPDVAGQTLAQASDAMESAGFKAKTAEGYSFTVPAGSVISQSVAPGKSFLKGRSVVLTVSLGIEQIMVPDLQGLTPGQAEEMLRELGFAVSISDGYSASVGTGLVCAQSVAPDTGTDKNSTVSLEVSIGTPVPNLVGTAERDAADAIETAGLVVNRAIQCSDTVEEGLVISQSLDPDAVTDIGTELHIVVSAGIANARGNTSANLVSLNSGFAAEQGNWVYVVIPVVGGDYLTNEDILRINKNTGETVTLCRVPWNVTNLNVVAEWIYFYLSNDGIYRLSIEGGEAQKIFEYKTSFTSMQVVGDYIYYTEHSEKANGSALYMLYRVKTDGSDHALLCEDNCNYFNIAGDYIYYYDEPNNGLYRINTDGSGRVRLASGRYEDLNVVGDTIYFSSGNWRNPYKAELSNPSKRTQFKDIRDGWLYINVTGDWIYCFLYSFNNEDSGIYKIKTDGTEKIRLLSEYDGMQVGSMIVVGDWIVFSFMSASEYYRMNLDGTDIVKIG
ncbi:MAG: PASTA domain-containing protein [Clostridiales bacterium]|nr:PASTA domain-containing protein [Clostridiales bacterium]